MPRAVRLPGRTELSNLYIDEGLSLRDIAAEYDCSPETIRQALIRIDVELRIPNLHHGNLPRNHLGAY